MNTRSGKTVEKVKVKRIENIFLMPGITSINRSKVIKDYVYSPEARIIA